MPKSSFLRFILHLHPRSLPEASSRITYTWCLGGLAAWLFVLETVSGVLLMFYYVPSPSQAYPSVQEITHTVPYGFFIRNLHYWCGQFMVVLVVLHMVRVFLTGSYAAPRRLNWVIGLGLLAATLLVDFTGYLLIWDDRALWAWTIARSLAEIVPGVGPAAASALFGPPEPTALVLVRLYTWHIVLLPLIMAVLMAWHFWRVRKDGISVRL